MIEASTFLSMDFLDSHEQQQQDAIGEALQELLCNEDSCDKAHEGIVKAIEPWLNYHQKELDKWKALLHLVAHQATKED